MVESVVAERVEYERVQITKLLWIFGLKSTCVYKCGTLLHCCRAIVLYSYLHAHIGNWKKIHTHMLTHRWLWICISARLSFGLIFSYFLAAVNLPTATIFIGPAYEVRVPHRSYYSLLYFVTANDFLADPEAIGILRIQKHGFADCFSVLV